MGTWHCCCCVDKISPTQDLIAVAEQMTEEVLQRTVMAKPGWRGTHPLGLPCLAMACLWR